MAATRKSKKRAASPAADPPPKKQPKRGAKAAAKAEPIDDEQDVIADAEPELEKQDEPEPEAEAEPEQKKPAKGSKSKQKKPAKDAPKFKEAQIAKAGSSYVPLDDGCPQGYRVYVDSDGIIYDASLNQTNSGNNNNKFYRIQLLEGKTGKKYQTWTRWGRVGDRGQTKLLGNGDLQTALKEFQSKFKSKTRLSWDDRGDKPKAGQYVFVERSYEPDTDEDEEKPAKAGASGGTSSTWVQPQCTLSSPVKSLMELIFNQQYMEATMAALNYDSTKLPLGKLSKATIIRGYEALKQLSDLIDDPSRAGAMEMPFDEAIEELSNLYFSTIPHAFGRNRPPIIRGNELLKREIELLESLTDLRDAEAIMKDKGTGDVHPLDSRYNGLGMQEMTPLDTNSEEFAGVSEYLLKTCGHTHAVNYQVLDIFRIERNGEDDRFQQSAFSKVSSDRRLLWHGSRATNYGGILGQGLRIAPPEAPVNGYMFDKGIYLADMSSKSANYCDPYMTGGHALLLLCEGELGDPIQVLTNAQYDAGTTAKEKGVYSTWGQGRVGPKTWKDAGCLHPSLEGVKMPDTKQKPGPTNVKGAYLEYNEYICYDVAQVRLRYLLRVRM